MISFGIVAYTLLCFPRTTSLETAVFKKKQKKRPQLLGLVGALVTVRTGWYLIQIIHQVGGTILYTYCEMIVAVTATIRIRKRKTDIDAFFYAFPFVWRSVVRNIQPYWKWFISYWWTMSWQSCSCSSFETIPVSGKS